MQNLMNFFYELDVSDFNPRTKEPWMTEGTMDKMFEGTEYLPLRFLARRVIDREETSRMAIEVGSEPLPDKIGLNSLYADYVADFKLDEPENSMFPKVPSKQSFSRFLKDQGFAVTRVGDHHELEFIMSRAESRLAFADLPRSRV